jgi:hypothetical protein
MEITIVFWNVTPYSLGDSYRCFEGMYSTDLTVEEYEYTFALKMEAIHSSETYVFHSTRCHMKEGIIIFPV